MPNPIKSSAKSHLSSLLSPLFPSLPPPLTLNLIKGYAHYGPCKINPHFIIGKFIPNIELIEFIEEESVCEEVECWKGPNRGSFRGKGNKEANMEGNMEGNKGQVCNVKGGE